MVKLNFFVLLVQVTRACLDWLSMILLTMTISMKTKISFTNVLALPLRFVINDFSSSMTCNHTIKYYCWRVPHTPSLYFPIVVICYKCMKWSDQATRKVFHISWFQIYVPYYSNLCALRSLAECISRGGMKVPPEIFLTNSWPLIFMILK